MKIETWSVAENAPAGYALRIWTDKPVRHAVADICISRSIDEGGLSRTERSRAALIVAAPELLDALEDMVRANSTNAEDFGPGDYVTKAFAKARAAIAKVRG